MNVRFFGGTKAEYLSLKAPRNPLGLYFCEDTKELFWADRLLTDGTRIVPTFTDLPSLEKAAEGITYFVEETRNGYVLSSDRTKWVQVIYAPDNGSAIKAISFADIELEEVDGVFTIDRRCAREALGFKAPEGMEDDELAIATEDFVKNEIEKISIPEVNLDGYATEQYVADAIAVINPAVEEVKIKLEEEVLPIIPTVQETVIPTVQKVETEVIPAVQELAEKAATQDWVKEQDYLTEHQDLSEYAKKSDLPEAELFVVDYNAPEFSAALEAYEAGKLLLLTNAAPDINSYAVMNYAREDMIAFTKFLMSRSSTYGSFNTYYLHNDNTWELAKEVKLNKVEANVEGEVSGELTSIKVGKEIYSLPNIDGLANDVPFTEDKFVTNSFGDFSAGESVKGLTVAQLFAKLLGLSDKDPTAPEVPKTPEEIVEDIIVNEQTMYSQDENGNLVETQFEFNTWTEEEAAAQIDGLSTVYQIIDDESGEVIESGYQEATNYNEEAFLTVALPDTITNVKVKMYNPGASNWEFVNWTVVPADEQTMEGYTIWTVPEKYEILSGDTYRFVIIN